MTKGIRLELASGVINRLQSCSPATGCGQRRWGLSSAPRGSESEQEERVSNALSAGSFSSGLGDASRLRLPSAEEARGRRTGREAGAVTMGTGGGADGGGAVARLPAAEPEWFFPARPLAARHTAESI